MRSAANAVVIRNHRVLNLFMDDTIEDVTSSMTRLATFISKAGFPAASAPQLRRTFIELENTTINLAKSGASPPVHVTAFASSCARKAALISRLKRDPVLTAITAAWYRALKAA
jgi:hypothetical protein